MSTDSRRLFHRIDTRDRLITSCLTHADPDLLTARTQHFSKGDLAAMLYLTQHPLEAASTIANLSYTGTEPKVVQLVAMIRRKVPRARRRGGREEALYDLAFRQLLKNFQRHVRSQLGVRQHS